MKKLLAVLLVTVLLASIFTSCGKDPDPETTTTAEQTTTTAAATSSDLAESTSIDQTGATGATTTVSGTATTTTGSGAATTTAAATTATDNSGAPVGGTVEQIVAFYNEKANTLKQDANYKIVCTVDQSVKFDKPALVGTFANMLLKDLTKVYDLTDTFVNGMATERKDKSINDFLTVKGQSYCSALAASNVTSATCTKEGSTVLINIKIKDENCNAKTDPPIFSTCINNVTEDIKNVKEVQVSDSAQAAYTGGELNLKYDLTSGKVTELKTHAKGVITGDVESGTVTIPFNGGKVSNCQLTGEFTETYKFTY